MISQAPDRSDISQLGRRIYRERIEPTLSPDDKGRFVVIDVDSGDYELADSDLEATQRLMQRRSPGRFYGIRVGHQAAYHLGVRSIASDR